MEQEQMLSQSKWNYFAKFLFVVEVVGFLIGLTAYLNQELLYIISGISSLVSAFSFLTHLAISALIEKDRIDKIFSMVDAIIVVVLIIFSAIDIYWSLLIPLLWGMYP